ncbi:MAG: DNA-3-methyladenine glycosylase [Patescibacteria group bacterium]
MTNKILQTSFYNRPTRQVAQDLLGKIIIRQIGRKKYYGLITETEAYCGPQDQASHASKGRTPRTEVMFGPAGHTYIYLIYGLYHCFNIVTEKKDYPAAVLIRGALPLPKEWLGGVTLPLSKREMAEGQRGLASGPGKLCRYFKIDKTLNNLDITKPNKLWLVDSGLKPQRIIRRPRVGVDYAGKYKDKKWRFITRFS